MLAGTRYNSFVVRGALTRAVQFAGRSTGQGDHNAMWLRLGDRSPAGNGPGGCGTPRVGRKLALPDIFRQGQNLLNQYTQPCARRTGGPVPQEVAADPQVSSSALRRPSSSSSGGLGTLGRGVRNRS